jgi:L-cysteate sulfo-lyase
VPSPREDSTGALLEPFPRETIGHLPTPLHPLPRLSAALGGPPLWVKRDDCTGLATGGNKTRKLEYLMGAARAEGADGIVSFGALQSNHARQTAAAAAALGFPCDLILVTNVNYHEPAWEVSGNRLLDELLGAKLHIVPDEVAAAQCLQALLGRANEAGKQLYVIPTGGSNAVGALGYVNCASELLAQCQALELRPGTLVSATSSLGTQSGLLVGLHAARSPIRVRGVNTYSPDPESQAQALRRLCDETAALIGSEPPPSDSLCIENGFLGGGYGVPSEAMQRAVEEVARLEGILLDPVYSGKAMAWLLAAVRAGRLNPEEPVVFLHTGGSPGLFAYQECLSGDSTA